MEKIGIGFITCDREDFLSKSIKSFQKFFPEDAKNIVIVNDGKKLEHNWTGYHHIEHKKNKGVGKSKNDAFRYLLDRGCTHIFIIEDDIIAKGDKNPFEEYIRVSKETGLQHMMFGYHGPANKNGVSGGTPTPRLVVDYDNDTKVALNLHCVGAFCYYSRKCLKEVGLMDKNYLNAFEHVDHSYMIAKAHMIPNYWWWPDISNSYEYLDEIQCSEHSSSIRPRADWQENIQTAAEYFFNKHGYRPAWSNYVPDINQRELFSRLKSIKQSYGA